MISCNCFHKTGQCCSGAEVGEPVTGGTANLLLYVDSAGDLAQNAAFGVDPTDGQLILASGSAAKPSLIFGDDTTGAFRPTTNQLSWAVSGVEAMRLGAIGPDSDQTLAIGRALIDSRGSDQAWFSHRDQTTVNSGAVYITAAGQMNVQSAAGQNIRLGVGGTPQWNVFATGSDFSPQTDNGKDIGQTALRIRRFFLGEYHEMSEMTAPAAPGANKARLYCEDNGAGKTRLVVLFPTGAAQVIATEP